MQRREALKGLGALAAIGSLSGVAAAEGDNSGSTFTSIGVNTFDADGDGDVDLAFVPARGRVGGRGGVRNLTSNGKSQGDYLTSIKSIPSTRLGAFTGSNPTTLEYDYYDTAENEAATPDEVWIRVNDDGTSRSFYRASNDNDEGGAVGEWLTREIHREIVGDPQFNQGFNWFEITDGGVNKGGTSLVDTVGEDATLERVGTGGSNFGGNVVTDFYVGKLRLDGHAIGNFPAEGRGSGNSNGNSRGR